MTEWKALANAIVHDRYDPNFMDDVSWALSVVVDSIQKYFTALREMQTYA